MKTTTLRIDEQLFFLEPDQDTTTLRADILATSRATSFVHFAAIGHGDVSILMSPGMSARFEVTDTSEDAATPLDASPRGCDFDSWLDAYDHGAL